MSSGSSPAGWRERLARVVEGEVRTDFPLAPRTSVRVGGAAELFVRPSSMDGLLALVRAVRDEGVGLALLGGGANTLVGDLGVPGVTLQLPSDLFPEEVTRSGGELLVTLGAGAPIARLIALMRVHGCVGAEFLAGIPGTLGGACAMNAGTKHGECMTVVDGVEVATAEGAGWLSRGSVAYRYRHTELPSGGVVTRVRFRLREGDVAASKATMDADLAYRKRTQPLSLPNFGSVFTNPPGDFAGRLIEQVALKGHRIGNAQISELHANWIVNLGGARASDVVGLMELARSRVREATGVELVPEVKKVGRFD